MQALKVARNAVYLLLTCAIVYQPALASPSISWNRGRVARIFAPGFSGIEQAQFVSNISLGNVDVFVVPELQPYLTVNPKHFHTIKASTPYALSLSFRVPAGAPLGSFIEGTVHLVQGSATLAVPLKVAVGLDVDAARQSDPSKVVSDGPFLYPVNEILAVFGPGAGASGA